MMGNWTDIRSLNGRLLGRIDSERRLLELVRNGEQLLVDLDHFILVTPIEQADVAVPPAQVGPQETK